jgi:hypothetical protein
LPESGRRIEQGEQRNGCENPLMTIQNMTALEPVCHAPSWNVETNPGTRALELGSRAFFAAGTLLNWGA